MSFTTIPSKFNRITFVMPKDPFIRYSIINVHRRSSRSHHPSRPTTIMPSSAGIGSHREQLQQRAPLSKPGVASFCKISIAFQRRQEKRSPRVGDLLYSRGKHYRCVIRWPVFHQLWSRIRRSCALVAIETITRWCDVVRVWPRWGRATAAQVQLAREA